MKPMFLLLAATGLFIAGCKKSSDSPTETPKDFQPLTTGSNWTYIATGSGAGTYKLTVTGADSTINGKAFKILANTNGPNNYVLKQGNDYYRFGYVQTPGGGAPTGLEFLYLKDNLDVNGAWENTQTISGIPVKLKYKVASKAQTRTVEGKNYSDVTNVHIDFVANVPGIGDLPVGTGEVYAARGIGIVQFQITINISGNVTSQDQRLQSYEIK
jgi:hypothetical protein